ncbi:MAG: rhomboid family intramembrane serine protease [Azospirillaceae bacterium]
MLPIRTDAPRGPRPARLVFGLIAVCAAVFLLQQSLPPRAALAFLAEHALVPRRYADPLWARVNGLDPDDHLPLVTMAFLHGGWLHLLFNMWTLWLFGRAVEHRLGSFRFGLLYFASALLASGAQMTVYPTSAVPTLGASGAIAGVLGAHAALYPRSKVLLLVPIIVIPLFFRISAFWYVAVWFGLQVLQGAGALTSGQAGGVAWWAHIGGFLAGLAFVALLTPPDGPPRRRGPVPAPWGARPPDA